MFPAIYYFFKEYQMKANNGEYHGEWDDLMYYYSLFYSIIQDTYKQKKRDFPRIDNYIKDTKWHHFFLIHIFYIVFSFFSFLHFTPCLLYVIIISGNNFSFHNFFQILKLWNYEKRFFCVFEPSNMALKYAIFDKVI